MRSGIIDGVKYVPQTQFKPCADVQSLGTALRAARREFSQSLSDQSALDAGHEVDAPPWCHWPGE